MASRPEARRRTRSPRPARSRRWSGRRERAAPRSAPGPGGPVGDRPRPGAGDRRPRGRRGSPEWTGRRRARTRVAGLAGAPDGRPRAGRQPPAAPGLGSEAPLPELLGSEPLMPDPGPRRPIGSRSGRDAVRLPAAGPIPPAPRADAPDSRPADAALAARPDFPLPYGPPPGVHKPSDPRTDSATHEGGLTQAKRAMSDDISHRATPNRNLARLTLHVARSGLTWATCA
jgi:hypothetical protein